jgi:flagellar hook-associated protein 2
VVGSPTDVGDLLGEIESVFGLSASSASVGASGEIIVTDSTAGESLLDVELIANNEGGGTLDFGDMEVTTQGYDIELAAGQDASLTVDGVSVSRSSNTLDDKADSGTTVTVQVNRDVDAITQTVQGVIDAYNNVVDFINKQNLFDEEDETSGILQGDATLLNVRSSLINVVTSPISGITGDINALSIVGINSDRNGKLSLDTNTFNDFLRSDFDEVKNLFLVNAAATDSNIEHVSSNEGTDPGTYDISITQLATQSSVTGTQDLSGGLAGAAALTVTFGPTGAQATVNFEAGDDIDVIVDRINTEFDQRAQDTHVADAQNLSGASAVQSSTTFSTIDGASVSAGDTISLTGTNRLGSVVSGVFSIDDPTTSFVENAFDNEVDVSLDDGYLVLKDTRTGASSLTLTITENNEGGGSLDFGTLSTANSSTNETGKEGRAEIPITASKDGSNQLVLAADSYGSSNTFTVSDSSDLGIFASNYTSGVDVEGTINGESTSGSGQILTGDGGVGTATDGLSILVSGSTTGSRGTISITKGVTEQLEELLDFFTASVTGNIPVRIDNVESSIDFIDDRIDRQEARLESKRERLTKQFVNMETTLAALQAINNFISQSLIQLSA